MKRTKPNDVRMRRKSPSPLARFLVENLNLNAREKMAKQTLNTSIAKNDQKRFIIVKNDQKKFYYNTNFLSNVGRIIQQIHYKNR